jgi:hypothetical protein
MTIPSSDKVLGQSGHVTDHNNISSTLSSHEAFVAAKGRTRFAAGAVTELTIPTYEASNEATHPSVVDLGASPVSGYRYWMAFTPYPGGDATKENPSIVASNDMATWVDPGTNPIVAYPGAGNWNSDVHLIWYGSEFWLYYRTSGSQYDTYSVVTSADGITWGAPTTVMEFPDSYDTISASFREVGSKVLCWYVRALAGPTSYPTEIYMRESPDGLVWSNPQKCVVSLPYGATPWHIDVDYGETDTGDAVFVLAANAYLDGGTGNEASLYLATSGDGVVFSGDAAILSPTASTFYDQGVYRPCILRNDDVFRVFFGAYKNVGTVSKIGYLDVTPTWGSIAPSVVRDTSGTERIIAECWAGTGYTVGTITVKGIVPTVTLAAGTDYAEYLLKSFTLPRATTEEYAVVDLYWLVEDANAGNIRFRVYSVNAIVEVDNLGGSQSAEAVLTVAAPGVANILQRSTTVIPNNEFQEDSIMSIRVARQGTHVDDTYASNALLVGFRVRVGRSVTSG